MRGLAWIVALVAVKAFGSVDIPAPRVEVLPADSVRASCDGRSERGCTQFRDVTLLCECLEQPNGWKLVASARAVPFVYVSRVNWVTHEMLHVWDFERYLTAHVTALGRRRFVTEAGCDHLARAAARAFPETMQRIARMSADRRDGKQTQRSEDHLVVIKAEVMPELVDDRLAHLPNDLPAAPRHAENRPAKDGDLVGKGGKHVEAALRQRNAAVDSEQLIVGRVVAKNVAVFVTRLFFDDDDHVFEKPRKLVRQLFESLFDELIELRA